MSFLTRLSRARFPYEPLIAIEISRGRLLHNLDQFRAFAPDGCIAPVLKSNAYGHGLVEVAHTLADQPNIPFFVVDSYFEAVALRAKGIKNPLLVIGYTRPDTILGSKLRAVAFAVTTMDTLRKLAGARADVRIHIKVDTGMRRQGITATEVAEAIEIVRANDRIKLEGVCTHLPDADNSDSFFTESQLDIWNLIARQFKAEFHSVRYIHSCNTDGSRFSRGTEDNLVRLGIGLYGLTETPEITSKLDLKPVLALKTILTGIREIQKGDSVGYSRTFAADHDMKIATVPVGYYEGIDRRLSSGPDNQPRASFQVGADKIACPVIGRVSMNITSIDVSAVPEASVGMEVTVISRNASDPNSIRSFAKACDTIDYEAAVRIPAHLKRVIVE